MGISKRQQPESTKMVILRDEFDMPVINKGKIVYSREMTYKVNGKFDGANKPITHVVIQDHSYGHKYESGIGNQTSHFTVRPITKTKNGKVKGTEEHYYFNSKYDFKD